MSLGRNDPCHCGSGRKYKKCHEAQDAEAARAPRLQLVRNAPEPVRRTLGNAPPPQALAGRWELAVAPFPGRFDDNPAARPVVVMLVTGSFIVSTELANRPPEDPEALAALMWKEVERTIDATGVVPPALYLRQATLAEPLRALLRGRSLKVAVHVQDSLPELDEAMQSLVGHMLGSSVPLSLLRAQPETWAGWGLPADLVSELFSAAAAFHKAAPWTMAGNEPPIRVSRANDDEWSMVVMGAAGEEYGLACYSSANDLDRLYGPHPPDPEHAFAKLSGRLVSLSYNARQDIPRRMREEIKAAQWDVAGPMAYPTLVVLNTPGGGISLDDVRLLCDALRTVPRFVSLHAHFFGDDTHGGVSWTDQETGLTCRLEAFNPMDALLSQFDKLAPSGPSGLGATPGISLSFENDEDWQRAQDLIDDTLARFRAWLKSPSAGKPVTDTTANTHERNARALLARCVYEGCRPATSITEYDLRSYLFDWYPRKEFLNERDARGLLTSLRRFFAFLQESERVTCPWAADILGDTSTFLERCNACPNETFWDPAVLEWQEEAYLEMAARLLLPDIPSSSGFRFGAAMAAVEHRMHNALHAHWLVWRDEVIAEGITAPAGVLAALQTRAQQWAETPQATLGGQTPAQVVRAEQTATAERLRKAGGAEQIEW